MSFSYKYNSNPSELFIKELRRRRYSERTIITYVYCLEKFLSWCKKPINRITKKDVAAFLELKNKKGFAGNTLNVNLMAIKFYFEEILGRKMWIDIKYSKVPKELPEVLSKEEVKKLIDSTKNLKHVLIISLLYSAGLRVSELVNLKVKDLNLEMKHGFVRNGKGGKDRIFILSDNLIKPLKRLIENEFLEDKDYLFKSNRNKKYSLRTIQKIVDNSAKSSGLKRKIHPHTLRHSFATHLIENGYALENVQSLLGHKSPETTMIYTHIASPTLINTRSPLDDLK